MFDEVLFAEIINYLNTDVYSPGFETIIRSIIEQFSSIIESGMYWKFQLSRLLIDYISKIDAVEKLNAHAYWDIISNFLRENGYRGNVSNSYQLNNVPTNQQVLSTRLAFLYLVDDKNYFTIYGNADAKENKDNYKITVVTHNNFNAGTEDKYYDSDIVIIYDYFNNFIKLKCKNLITNQYTNEIILDSINNVVIPETLKLKP